MAYDCRNIQRAVVCQSAVQAAYGGGSFDAFVGVISDITNLQFEASLESAIDGYFPISGGTGNIAYP